MTDERPRPKYGEYAPIDAAAQPDAVATQPAPVEPRAADIPAVTSPEPSQAIDGTDAAAAPRHPHRTWDVVLTTALLLMGVYSVVTSADDFLHLGPLLSQLYATQGIGEYTSTELAAAVGVALVIAQVVVLVVTIVISLVFLARHRIAFYIPLAGAVLNVIVIVACLLIAMLGDPAFLEYSRQ
jgi:hypothetical protein